jgi:hypothetical protein
VRISLIATARADATKASEAAAMTINRKVHGNKRVENCISESFAFAHPNECGNE